MTGVRTRKLWNALIEVWRESRNTPAPVGFSGWLSRPPIVYPLLLCTPYILDLGYHNRRTIDWPLMVGPIAATVFGCVALMIAPSKSSQTISTSGDGCDAMPGREARTCSV